MKSISAVGAYKSSLLDRSVHQHGTDVQDVFSAILFLTSMANRTEAMCEQASSRPAMQVKCAHKTVPLSSAQTHDSKNSSGNDCTASAVAPANGTVLPYLVGDPSSAVRRVVFGTFTGAFPVAR